MTCPVSVQKDPHAALCVFLVGDSIPLYALPDGVDGRAKMLGSLLDTNTCPGRMSCGVLSLFHMGILLDHQGRGRKPLDGNLARLRERKSLATTKE